MNSDALFKCLIEVPRHGIKKNGKSIFQNRATGRRFIASNSKAQYLEHFLIKSLILQRLKNRTDLIDCGINAQIIFHYPESVYFTKDGRRSNRVGDLSNLYQIVEDSLQTAEIISNDANIESHDGSQRRPITGAKSFLEIVLTRSIINHVRKVV